MKCNVIFANIVESIEGDVVIQNPTFTFYSKYIPTLYSLGISVTFSDFEKTDGNTFGLSIVNDETTDVVYTTGTEEPVPALSSTDDSITFTSMLNNLEIQNESNNTLFVFFNGEVIHSSKFVVKKERSK